MAPWGRGLIHFVVCDLRPHRAIQYGVQNYDRRCSSLLPEQWQLPIPAVKVQIGDTYKEKNPLCVAFVFLCVVFFFLSLFFRLRGGG